MNYEEPQVNVNGENGQPQTYGSWLTVEMYVAAVGVAIMNVAITAIDVTP